MAKHNTNDRDMRKRIVNLLDTSLIAPQTRDLVDLTVTGAERETFVSCKGNLLVHPLVANAGALGIALIRVPEGSAVLSMNITDNAQLYANKQHLLWGILLVKNGGVDTEEMLYIPMDIGAKRKCRPGDKIMWLYKSGTDAGWQISGHFASFTMED